MNYPKTAISIFFIINERFFLCTIALMDPKLWKYSITFSTAHGDGFCFRGFRIANVLHFHLQNFIIRLQHGGMPNKSTIINLCTFNEHIP